MNNDKTTLELVERIQELEEEVKRLERELASQTYQGNSISYIYDKMLGARHVGKLAGDFIRERDLWAEWEEFRASQTEAMRDKQ